MSFLPVTSGIYTFFLLSLSTQLAANKGKAVPLELINLNLCTIKRLRLVRTRRFLPAATGNKAQIEYELIIPEPLDCKIPFDNLGE